MGDGHTITTKTGQHELENLLLFFSPLYPKFHHYAMRICLFFFSISSPVHICTELYTKQITYNKLFAILGGLANYLESTCVHALHITLSFWSTLHHWIINQQESWFYFFLCVCVLCFFISLFSWFPCFTFRVNMCLCSFVTIGAYCN